MLFNSLSFAIFFAIVFALYWTFSKSMKIQNWLLIAASYFFYANWDWRFLFLLIFSTLLDYYTGLKIHKSESSKGRKFWLFASVLINLGFLGFFKYYNFFITSFAEMLSAFGMKAHYPTLNIILPVGISFYTFHGLSYVFDIYNRRIKPTTNFVNYSLFVSFFPLLVAGPIERATHLLPQMEKPRSFVYGKAMDGLRQILWGLFKKVVIADSCAMLVSRAFEAPDEYAGVALIFAAILFAFQIYGDFSGYSDIALGTARLMGFELLQNFRYPYFSRDIAEFWRRWHISLSSWFKDYLYIPLGGSKGGTWMRIRNTMIIFLVSGFWHGANWTFIFWGFLNAVFIIPSIIFQTNRNNMEIVAEDRSLPTLKELFQILATFALTVFAWIFFRAESMTHAFDYLSSIFPMNLGNVKKLGSNFLIVSGFIIVMIVVEWISRRNSHGLQGMNKIRSKALRWTVYLVLTYLILFFLNRYPNAPKEFIYFQF